MRAAARILLLALAIGPAACARFPPPIARDLAAQDRWMDLDALVDRRLAVTAGLLATLRASPTRDEPAVQAAAEARARANQRMTGSDFADPTKVAAWVRAQDDLGAALARLLAIGARHPDVFAAPDVRGAEHDLAAIEEALPGARSAYDAAARAYDQEIAALPRGARDDLTGRRFLPRIPLSDAGG